MLSNIKPIYDSSTKKRKKKDEKINSLNNNNKKENNKKENNKRENNKELEGNIYQEKKIDLEIEENIIENSNVLTLIIANVSSLLNTKSINSNKVKNIIEILDAILSKNTSIHILSDLQKTYHKLILKSFITNSLSNDIIESIYLFFVKLKYVKKKVSRKESFYLEKGLLNTLEILILSFNIDNDHINNILSILIVHLSVANKDILPKYVGIYIRLNKLVIDNNLENNNSIKNSTDEFKKIILNKLNLFPELNNYYLLIKNK